jgi:hypothetical protein
LKRYLKKEHFTLVFEEAKINEMLTIMKKEAHIREMGRRLEIDEEQERNMINYMKYKKSHERDRDSSIGRFKGKKSLFRQAKKANIIGEKIHYVKSPRNFKEGPNRNPAQKNELRREIELLSRNKNVLPNGKLKFGPTQIPENVKNGKDFSIKNYLPPKEFSHMISMAKANISQRKSDRATKATKTRQHKRRRDNKQRRTNVMIEPDRCNYVNGHVEGSLGVHSVEHVEGSLGVYTIADTNDPDSFRINLYI